MITCQYGKDGYCHGKDGFWCKPNATVTIPAEFKSGDLVNIAKEATKKSKLDALAVKEKTVVAFIWKPHGETKKSWVHFAFFGVKGDSLSGNEITYVETLMDINNHHGGLERDQIDMARLYILGGWRDEVPVSELAIPEESDIENMWECI